MHQISVLFCPDLMIPYYSLKSCTFDRNSVTKFEVTNARVHSYMPYLTQLDKISQNLALLKADFHKIFKSHRIFRPFKNTFYKEIIINHTLLCYHKFPTLIKSFMVILGEFQTDFCEKLTEFYQISLEIISQVYGMYVHCTCGLARNFVTECLFKV